MKSQELARNGGAPAMRPGLELRRVQLTRGIQRTWDLLQMVPLTLSGRTSVEHGRIVDKFERAFADMTGSQYALATNSGTAALHSAYMALGVGPGTEVIVPTYTWHASATPVLQCGAVPVFCEIDPRTLTIDVDDMERRITERTRVICVLHTWGNPAPMDRIREIADRHGVAVVEDCSHAHGAKFKGRAVGAWGQVGCFSLQGSKTVEGGEAGVAVTDDRKLYDRMLLLGHNKLVDRSETLPYGDISLGVKYRPHPAAMYLAYASLQRLDARNRRAAAVWKYLCDELGDAPGLRPIATHPDAERGGYYFFVFEYRGEDFGGPDTQEFVAAVRAEGAPIDLDQYREGLLHMEPIFTELDRRELGGGCWDPTRPWEENLWKGDLPTTERLVKRLVRFPGALQAHRHAYVRDTVRAVKKVLAALVPVDAQTAAQADAPRESTSVASG